MQLFDYKEVISKILKEENLSNSGAWEKEFSQRDFYKLGQVKIFYLRPVIKAKDREKFVEIFVIEWLSSLNQAIFPFFLSGLLSRQDYACQLVIYLKKMSQKCFQNIISQKCFPQKGLRIGCKTCCVR